MGIASDEFARYRGVHDPKPHHPVFSRFDCWRGVVPARRDHNFLGVHTRVDYFSMYDRLADFSSERELTTTPPMQNEDYFEWIDLLESVSDAIECFRMIELGAGWGRWIANGAAAARQLGLDYFVIGVEAEPRHFKWMRRHLRENKIDLKKARLIRAAIAPTDGPTWFHIGDAADWYGQQLASAPEIEEDPSWRERAARAMGRGSDERRVQRVPTVSLQMLLASDAIVDLIDADIQGVEADVFEAAAPEVDRVVKRVHIGTHSAENETRLRELFSRLGWENVNDFPGGQVNETPYGAMPFEDGVQTWINPRCQPPS